MRLNHAEREDIIARNNAQKAFYETLRRAGEKRVYYVSGDKLLDEMKEGTVDGVHFTDLGVTYYAKALLPTIKKALKASPNKPVNNPAPSSYARAPQVPASLTACGS